jgi:hypothetical protein
LCESPRKAAAELPHSKPIEFATRVVRVQISFLTKLITRVVKRVGPEDSRPRGGLDVYRLACAKDDAMRR